MAKPRYQTLAGECRAAHREPRLTGLGT